MLIGTNNTSFESTKIKSSLSSGCSTIVIDLINSFHIYISHIHLYILFPEYCSKNWFQQKMLSLDWIYHIHEGKNCLQDTNFASLYQICFLTWACILVFSSISFFQNMEYLGRLTCMLISNIILEILFTGASDILQQHTGRLQVKLLYAGI